MDNLDNIKNSVSVDEALAIILESVTPLDGEYVGLFESSGRVLYDDITATFDVPPFNNSAMDGYAVRFQDVSQAAKNRPIKLRVIGEIKAGDFPEKPVAPMSAFRIMTGAPIPPDCDAVIPVEETDDSNSLVSIYRAVKKHDNIRFSGEDIPRGSKVLSRGDMIRPADAGLLASLNIGNAPVFRKPKVAIVSTGDEIIDAGAPDNPGKIRNSNAHTLYSLVSESYSKPSYLGIIRDNPDETTKKLCEALGYDVVITTGGVSMGKYDFVKEALLNAGVNLLIEKIRMKPGKPLIFGKKGKTLYFGLPGNPVSAMISFMQFVRPSLLKLIGANKIFKPSIRALFTDEYRKKTDRTHFLRGFFSIENNLLHVSLTGAQGSGILRSMSEANCLIVIPENIEIVKPGDWVNIQMICHEEF